MRASNRVAVASFARSTRENFRSRRSPRVFHTPARPTESRFDDDPFENNRPMPILRRRSFYSGPTVAPIFYHTPSPHRSSLLLRFRRLSPGGRGSFRHWTRNETRYLLLYALLSTGSERGLLQLRIPRLFPMFIWYALF